MNLPNAFNAAGDFVVSRSAWQVKLAALFIGVLVALAWLHHHDRDIRTSERLDANLHAAMIRDTVLVERKVAVGARIDTLTKTVTRTTHRVDTLWAAVPETLVTRADTVHALDALPVLRRSTDSAITACSDFQISCSEYRRVADSLETTLRDENTILRKQVGLAHPSKFGIVVTWAAIIGAGYVGYRVGRLR
jgi:hypothetical protein